MIALDASLDWVQKYLLWLPRNNRESLSWLFFKIILWVFFVFVFNLALSLLFLSDFTVATIIVLPSILHGSPPLLSVTSR